MPLRSRSRNVQVIYKHYWRLQIWHLSKSHYLGYLIAFSWIIPHTWRPFDSGNRVCIGQRFAMMEMKIIIAKLLSKFKLTLTEKSGLEEQKVRARRTNGNLCPFPIQHIICQTWIEKLKIGALKNTLLNNKHILYLTVTSFC